MSNNIKRLTVLAVDTDATKSFLKCVIVMIQYCLEGSTSKELQNIILQHKPACLPFLDAFKIKKLNLNKALVAITNNTKYSPVIHELFYECGVDIQQALGEVYVDNTIPKEAYDLLKDCSLWLRTESEAAFRRIEQKVGWLQEPALNQSFLGDVGSQKPLITALRKVVQKLGGNGILLPIEDRAAAREKFPDLYKEFLRLNREIREIYKTELRNYVRSSGKAYLPYQDIVKHFTDVGVLQFLPEGFIGNVDENGKLYTIGGKLIDGVSGSSVMMNPSYNDKTNPATYVFQSTGIGTNSQRYYTAEAKKKATQEKFAKVTEFATKIESIKNKWRRTLVGGRAPLRDRTLAAILEILYLTSARIGTVGNMTSGKPTYGISTLLVGHVKFSAAKVDIRYTGKKGVAQHHIIQGVDKEKIAIINLMKSLVAGKAADDDVWEVDGTWISPTEINNYLRKLGAGAATAHKLRHVRGTELALKILEDCPLEEGATQAETEKWYREAMIPVGEALSHTRGVGTTEKATSATAIANYIAPELQTQFFLSRGLRIPSFLKKFE